MEINPNSSVSPAYQSSSSNSVIDETKEFEKKMDEIYNNSTLSPVQKREQIDSLKLEATAAYLAANGNPSNSEAQTKMINQAYGEVFKDADSKMANLAQIINDVKKPRPMGM